MQALATIVSIVSLVAAGVFMFTGWKLYAKLALAAPALLLVSFLLDEFIEGWSFWIYLLPLLGVAALVYTMADDARTPADANEENQATDERNHESDTAQPRERISTRDGIARIAVAALTVVALIFGIAAVNEFNELDDRMSKIEAWAADLNGWFDRQGFVTQYELDTRLDEITQQFATVDDVEAVKDTLEKLTEGLDQHISDRIHAEVGATLASNGGVRPVTNPAVRRFNGGSEMGVPVCSGINPDGRTGAALQSYLASLPRSVVDACVAELDARFMSDEFLLADELTATGLDSRPYGDVVNDLRDPRSRLAALEWLREARTSTAIGCLGGTVVTQFYGEDGEEIKTVTKQARCDKDIVVVSTYQVDGNTVTTHRRISCGGQRMAPPQPTPETPPVKPRPKPKPTPTTTSPPTTTATTVPPSTSVPPPTTTAPEPKCFNEDGEPIFDGEFCGTPDSGPEQQPPQDNDPEDVAPTPNAPEEEPPPPPEEEPTQEERDAVGGGNEPPPELETDDEGNHAPAPEDGDDPPPPPPP